MEITLQLTARAVAGLDRASARCPQLLQLRACLRLQSLTLERESGGGADGLEQPWIVDQFGAVH